jgi:NIPSNAP
LPGNVSIALEASASTHKETTMSITCFTRYEIDPFRKDAFEEYARAWGQAIPRCGADLIGYFAPHEGSATTAYALYTVENLAAYEAYRARLAKDPEGKANFEFARRERFILKEDRIFLKLASVPHAPLVTP